MAGRLPETDHFETVIVTSDTRLSGTPASCICPLQPSIELSSDTLEIILQSFSWVAGQPTGVVNPSYNAIPFQEAVGGATVCYLPNGNYTTNQGVTMFGPQSYIGTAVQTAMNAASPNGWTYTYSTGLLQQSIVAASGGAFKFLWSSGPSLGLGPASSYLAYALGYGAVGPTITDTAAARFQVSPSIQNLSGTSGFLLTITAPATFPTGAPYSSGGTPCTWVIPTAGSNYATTLFFNNAPFSGRLKTGFSSGLSTMNSIGVTLRQIETYPPYPLTTLSDWKLTFIIRRRVNPCQR